MEIKIKKNNLLLWLLIVSNLLTCRMFSQNEITDKETIPEINKNRDKKTFIISSHHISAMSIFSYIETINSGDILFIFNSLSKFNFEFPLYKRFYLRTYFFNNIVYLNIPKQEENAETQENNILNTSKNSAQAENEKCFKVLEFFSLTIGKKIFYSGSNNMFSLEIGFYIGSPVKKNNNEGESLIHKIISKFIIILNLYRRTFKNNIYISFGHIFINPCSIYDVLKYRKKDGGILFDFISTFIINMLSFNFGYDFPYDT